MGPPYIGGAAGIRAVRFFSTTYFGEIIIFGLNKDQTFRNRSTLENVCVNENIKERRIKICSFMLFGRFLCFLRCYVSRN
jgi:hypothetical protein